MTALAFGKSLPKLVRIPQGHCLLEIDMILQRLILDDRLIDLEYYLVELKQLDCRPFWPCRLSSPVYDTYMYSYFCGQFRIEQMPGCILAYKIIPICSFITYFIYSLECCRTSQLRGKGNKRKRNSDKAFLLSCDVLQHSYYKLTCTNTHCTTCTCTTLQSWCTKKQ